MGFFDLLFGSSSKEVQTPIRDKFRNRKYFNRQVDRNLRLGTSDEKSIADAKMSDNNRVFSYWSLSLNRMSRLNIMYSIGEDIKELKNIYLQSFNSFMLGFDIESPTYADIIKRISLGVLLDVPEDNFCQLRNYVKGLDEQAKPARWKPDALLWFMLNSNAKEEEKQTYAKDLSIPHIYKNLYRVTEMNDKEVAIKALTEYLEKWYNLNRDAPWYNTHLRENGYSGYWAWEIAAVAKIMQLDDSHLKDNPYYPYDMAHWDATSAKY